MSSVREANVQEEAKKESIGHAWMHDDLSINMILHFDLPGMMGDSLVTFNPGDPQYQDVIRHLGGISPGESKLVEPWPDTPVQPTQIAKLHLPLDAQVSSQMPGQLGILPPGQILPISSRRMLGQFQVVSVLSPECAGTTELMVRWISWYGNERFALLQLVDRTWEIEETPLPQILVTIFDANMIAIIPDEAFPDKLRAMNTDLEIAIDNLSARERNEKLERESRSAFPG